MIHVRHVYHNSGMLTHLESQRRHERHGRSITTGSMRRCSHAEIESRPNHDLVLQSPPSASGCHRRDCRGHFRLNTVSGMEIPTYTLTLSLSSPQPAATPALRSPPAEDAENEQPDRPGPSAVLCLGRLYMVEKVREREGKNQPEET